VGLVRTDVSEESIASIIGLTRIGELGTTLAVTGNRSRLQRNNISNTRIIISVLNNVIFIVRFEVFTA
jgi:hypothetical protein